MELYFQLFSVLVSMGGIVLMGKGEGFENASAVGIILVTVAALCAASFQVVF